MTSRAFCSTKNSSSAATRPSRRAYSAAYARVDYIQKHRLPRSGLAAVGANLSVALTKRITLVVGYGYGIDARRGHGFGGHDVDAQFEFK